MRDQLELPPVLNPRKSYSVAVMTPEGFSTEEEVEGHLASSLVP
jgi:hypothetical protein